MATLGATSCWRSAVSASMWGRHSAGAEKFIHSHADVLGDLTEQGRRDIAAFVGRNGCAASTGITELQVRSALTDKLKTQWSPRSGRQHDLLQANEIALQRRLAVFQQHGDHLLEVCLQFFEGLALAVSARKARNVANE
jgi:hypothetical protein